MKKLISILLTLALCLGMTSALADTFGLGMNSEISATSATVDKDGFLRVETAVCALTLDENGVITSIRFDMIQTPKVSVSVTGTIADTANIEIKSKNELGADYGMVVASGIQKEYFEQMAALEAWCVGKTPDEVAGGFADDADAKAGCTVSTDSLFAAMQKAAANAK